jgi:hypothetical protein
MSDGRINLRLRCPDCSRGERSDILASGGVVALAGRRSFRSALKRVLGVMQPYYAQAVTQGSQLCLRCKAVAPLTIIGPEERREELPRRWPGLLLLLACPACGVMNGTSPGMFVRSTHVAALRFLDRHPRSFNEPEQLVEYEGDKAIRIRLTDRASASRLTLFVRFDTCQVLATVQR